MTTEPHFVEQSKFRATRLRTTDYPAIIKQCQANQDAFILYACDLMEMTRLTHSNRISNVYCCKFRGEMLYPVIGFNTESEQYEIFTLYTEDMVRANIPNERKIFRIHDMLQRSETQITIKQPTYQTFPYIRKVTEKVVPVTVIVVNKSNTINTRNTNVKQS